jgi:hypothetical protein
MREPIAEQELTLKRPTGVEQKVIVRMWPPERGERGTYECRAEIELVGEEPIRFSGEGADAFQAITFAMSRIPICMARIDASGGLSLEWDNAHQFPPAFARSADPVPHAGALARTHVVEVGRRFGASIANVARALAVRARRK